MSSVFDQFRSYRVLSLLGIFVVISALAVVYVSDLNRRLFVHYQAEQSRSNQLNIEWGQLLLEQSTWATQARIQSIAQEKLDMVFPTQNETIIVK